MCSEELVKKLQPLYHTNRKACRSLCYGCCGGDFRKLQSWGFAPSEEQIESDQL